MHGLALATLLIWLMGCGLWVRVVRGPGVLSRVRHLVSAVLVTVVGMLLAALLVIVQAFEAFSGETLVARVTTARVAPTEFELTYAPVASPLASASAGVAAQTVRLAGDQWAISGGIVKWHPWLTALGLNSYHKPTRLSGQFSRLEAQRRRPPTVAALSPALDRFWEALYRAQPYLPCIEAVYGSSAYVYVEPDMVQEVYVTPSGYLIKKRVK